VGFTYAIVPANRRDSGTRLSLCTPRGFIAAEGTLFGVGLALLTLCNIVTNTDAMGELPEIRAAALAAL
jgi:hypothetical protein